MKIFILIIQFILLTNIVYSQIDSLSSPYSVLVNYPDSISVANYKPVSMTGAVILSTCFPGCGLFLSDNKTAAISYLSLASLSYSASIFFLSYGEDDSDNLTGVFLTVAFLTHIMSIVQTISETEEYNSSIIPVLTFNGKVCQFGLSLNF